MLKTKISPQYQKRREQLMALDAQGCFIFFGAGEITRSNDSHYPFRQNSNFYYLTGLDEPNAVLVLVEGKSHLFVLDRDESREIWDGERYGVERALSFFHVDACYSEKEFFTKLPELLKPASRIYYTLQDRTRLDYAKVDHELLTVIHDSISTRGKGSLGNLPIFDPMPLVSELRMVKDAGELNLIRFACSVSAQAHHHVLKTAKAGMNEFDLVNEFQYFMQKKGIRDWGYTPIFASGANATTLHYIRNNDVLKAGDLMLIDAGGEHEFYTADITQTFPVSAQFTEAQRKVYAQVLLVNQEIAKIVKPGVSYRSIHTESVKMITESLKSLGVNMDDASAYRKYYPHGLGHYLGIDVHDAGIYQERGKDFLLKPGMIMTNEPGLYFRGSETPYQGIGIRIEDDLLITDQGCENLTHELPRTIDEIENLRA